MVGEWAAIGRNLENWMSCLPEEICRSVPIIHLAIPGSHVSASYTIDMGSAVSPDCQTLVTTVGSLIKPLLLKWAVTQSSSIAEQLRTGVRYLDLRVASCPKGKQIHVVHGLYGGQIYDILIEVDMFLRSHKHEMVIVDFQRFYKFSPTNHTQLRETVKGIFGNKLCPLPTCLFNLTLSSMREQGYQAVVIYREQNLMPKDDTELLWPSRSWLVYRPISVDASTMLRELERDVARRPSGAQGYISVCAITPNSTFMQKNVMSNHSDACVKPCQSVIIPWIDIHRSGHARFNVLVTDFVDSIPFCETVIALNRKLLR
ncbi:PI-PLC X domain-containing protein 2 [Anabrus simplex]|uniref:PI-PLC X domain-containing protein 2 n=1 Tax=Anabrus simplex TaxID=316456 RepID=UPI0035A29D52